MNVERFLIQVKQNLPEHEGVTTWVEDSALNVGYGKTESFEIRYPGGICYNAATEKTDEFYKLVEEADKAFKTVKEYIDLMDNAPELSARDFNMPYKLLAEFNGVVLGGIEHRSNNTFEFTTWSYANNSLYHGHYFTDYEKAKEDFAVRSGLLQSTKLFTDKEMMQIYAENLPYIEIAMSQSQFAQAITSLNMGAGVPVTLTRLNGEYIEPCPFVDKREQFSNEFRQEMNELTKKIKETTKAVEELIENKRTFTKADKEQILSALNAVSMQLGSNYPYMYSMFNEQMDKTVTEAKAEIESHLQARMEDVALKAMGKAQEPEMLPEEEQDIEEDGGMLMGGM